MPTLAELRTYVGASNVDDAFLLTCLDTATELVDHFIGTNTVPATVSEACILRVGSELFHARQAPNGIAQFAGFDGSAAVRIARDPMTPAYALLSAYMVVGF